jgi:hypothetical protein
MKIITPATNNVDFIKLQHASFIKYVKIPYEFIVFNDGKDFPDWTNYGDSTMQLKIENVCNELKISCINVPNSHHRTEQRAGKRHIDTVTFMTKYMFDNPDIYFQIDSDMFFVGNFDFSRFERYDCAVVQQNNSNFNYVWPNLFYFNIPRLQFKEHIDWDGTVGADTGGKMAKWLELYKEIPDLIYFIKHLPSCTWKETELPNDLATDKLLQFLKNDVRNRNGKFWCELYDSNILHYRAGSNWNSEGKQLHNLMTERLTQALSLNT